MAQCEIVSIILPFYNEAATLRAIGERILNTCLPEGFDSQIILVDDGSTDGSRVIAEKLCGEFPSRLQLVHYSRNRGKGHAIRAALSRISTGICLIQDADLEYHPEDYGPILALFQRPEVKVVYGSRILGSRNRSYSRYYWGGRLLTLATNFLFQSRISDEATGYKAFRREVVEGLDLKANGFEFCPELTGKILKKGLRIWEVPIRYSPRSFASGKKIRLSDGIFALWTLFKIRFSRELG